MKILIAAGGTGGHIYPGIALAKGLQQVDMKNQILFVGSSDGIEKEIVLKERFSIATIRSRGMLRKLSYRSISSPFIAVIGFFQSLRIIRKYGPDIVIVTGGYISVPVAFAAFVKRIPVILHEENVKPGISARLIKWIATIVTISFGETKKYFKLKRKVYCFGNPVRQEIYSTLKGIGIQNLGLKQDKKIILIFGGSQGARSINKVVVDSLPLFSEFDYQVVHVSGERDYESIRGQGLEQKYPFYKLISYMYNIADGFAAADLVISRAGATTISEIAARGIPSILIPFPYSSEGHQDLNARSMSDAGASRVIRDKDLDEKCLVDEVRQILGDRELYDFMKNSAKSIGRPEAADEIVKMIYSVTGLAIKKKV